MDFTITKINFKIIFTNDIKISITFINSLSKNKAIIFIKNIILYKIFNIFI